MKSVELAITEAQINFDQLVARFTPNGEISKKQYARFLSMQYHLILNIQQQFLCCAGAWEMRKYTALRNHLVEMAFVEEPHYQLTLNDLKELGEALLPEPLDVILWHAFWRPLVQTHPFFRLGAICVLENISAGPAQNRIGQLLFKLSAKGYSLSFAQLHHHTEETDHGKSLLTLIADAKPDASTVHEIRDGIKIATVLYLRAFEWALNVGSLSGLIERTPTFVHSHPLAHVSSQAEVGDRPKKEPSTICNAIHAEFL